MTVTLVSIIISMVIFFFYKCNTCFNYHIYCKNKLLSMTVTCVSIITFIVKKNVLSVTVMLVSIIIFIVIFFFL